MEQITKLHRDAMALLDEADVAKRHGNPEAASKLMSAALALERQAADALDSSLDIEPTRSVLHRSAAAIAVECRQFLVAERYVCRALSGNPPIEVAEELRDFFEQINFERHLDLRGVTLQPDELQMSMAGNAIGFGMTPSDLFIDRVSQAEKLLSRTAERKAQRPYRSSGPPPASIAGNFKLFLSAPRAASFAVSLKIGHDKQFQLPGLDLGTEVVDEFLECLKIFNSADRELLRAKIPNEQYFDNFVGLARGLAPDGDRVKVVGFTAVRKGQLEKVEISRTQQDSFPPSIEKLPNQFSESHVQVFEGILSFADVRKEENAQIMITPAHGKEIRIFVPQGMMDDIVRPMWHERVVIETSQLPSGNFKLETIRKASP